jgi:tetratricopeptide (TPR) repeat protein
VANDRQQFDQAMRVGAQHAWDNDWNAAIQQYQLARAEFPDDPLPYDHLGQAHYQLGEYAEALNWYVQAAKLNPMDVVAMGRIADLLERSGQLDQAARTYMAVAEAYLQKRDLGLAIANWERATRLDNNLIGARQRLAFVYHREGRLRESIREHLALARIHQSRGDSRQAFTVCQAALELQPDNTDVLAAVQLLEQGRVVQEPPVDVLGHSGQSPTERETTLGEALWHAVDTLSGTIESTWDGDTSAQPTDGGSPVEDARQAALADLAGTVFEEDRGDLLTSLRKQDRDALISQAIAHQTRGEIEQAIVAYERAIASGVVQPAARFNLGLLYKERLRLDEAIQQLQWALSDPEYVLGSHFALGECFRVKGKLDEALAHFMQVAKIVDLRTVGRDQADDLVRLYENLADMHAARGEPEQAAAFAQALVEFLSTKGWEDKVRESRERLDAITGEGETMSLAEILAVPGCQGLLESLAMTTEYARRGWWDTAMEECYRAVHISPFFLPVHQRLARLLEERGQIEAAGNKYVMLAQAYRNRGDIGRAMATFEKAMALAPLDMTLRTRLIELLKRHGEIDRALEHYVALAESYYQLAQIDRAREKYLEALQLAPRGSQEKQWTAKILHRTADIDMQRLNWRDAVNAYAQIVRIAPDDERANITLVELLFKLDRGHEALTELDRFLARLASQGRTRKILAILDDLLAQKPTNMGLLQRLAWAFAQAGDPKKAIEYLDRLGEVQLDRGMRIEAATTIRAILALEPADAEGYRRLYEQIRLST